MPLVWNNRNTYSSGLDKLNEEYMSAAVDILSKLGDQVIKYARENKEYVTRTGNLFNSTGYIVIHNGKIIKESFNGDIVGPEEGGDINMAHEKGRKHATDIARKLPKTGAYLIWVAGMQYAAYVEAKGYDVIQGSGNWVESNAHTIIQDFIKAINDKYR